LFGTPEFVAPEVVNFDDISYATDMWSVGVITYVLLSGLSPFMGETDVETMANVTIAKFDFDDDSFDDISEDARDFISKLLTKDKKKKDCWHPSALNTDGFYLNPSQLKNLRKSLVLPNPLLLLHLLLPVSVSLLMLSLELTLLGQGKSLLVHPWGQIVT
jgi:serine/threonine protein kinase